ncbi:MAG: polyamine aminopropyltransferase [Patescibacteria group bacterium]
MSLERRNSKLWFFEDLYSDTAYGFEVSKIIVPRTKTKYQELAILDTPRFGKVFILDGIVQFTEEDEAIYHEIITHWPIFTHPNPKNVLIIGGGDGGVLREVCKHKNIKKIYLVEIDSKVIDASKKYLPKIANGAFADKRVKVYCEDAAKFVKKTREKFDVVIMDTTDPIGPAKSLFSAKFMQNVYKILNDKGILIRQAGSVILQPYELRGNWRQLEVIFGKNKVKTLLISSTTYFGGPFSLIAAIKGNYNFDKFLPQIKEKYIKSEINTLWYSDKIHKSVQVLSPSIKTMLDKEKYGEEIVIDLNNCPLPLFSKIKEWAAKTCKAINMLAFGKPMLSNSEMKMNTSFVQYIETSAINYRQCGKIGCANIFTCAELPTNEAIKFSMDFLKIKNSVCWYLPRGSFGNIKKLYKETRIFDVKTNIGKPLKKEKEYLPVLNNSKKVFSPNFKNNSFNNLSAFELVMDLYDCDYDSVASCEKVKKWAFDFCKVADVRPIGKAKAPDFGHAKKKTAGPSVTQFFDQGSNISHYSANWLAVLINIVSRKKFNLKKAIRYTMKFFKSKRAICWLLPRGLSLSAEKIAQKTIIFEVIDSD